jgi:chromosome segregation ATPase
MSFQEFIEALGFHGSFTFWSLVAFLMSLGIEFFPKIKWNPWSSFFNWVGSKINSKIDNKIDVVRSEIKDLNEKINKVQNDLSDHITESSIKSLEDTRRDILDFCNACMKGEKHTKEQYDFMIKKCDNYETYIAENNVKNGVIEAAIKEIRRLYEERLHKNDFLKEGE